MKWTLEQIQGKAARLALAAGMGVILTAGSGLSAQSASFEAAKGNGQAEVFGVAGPRDASFAAKAARATPAERAGIDVSSAPQVRLERLDTSALLHEDEGSRTKGSVRISVGRDLKVGALDGSWFELAGGERLWSAEIVATDALGLRLHFSDLALPAGAELAVYEPTFSRPERGVVKSGSSRFDPDRNVEIFSGDNPELAKSLWTATHFGESVRVELRLPAGAAGDDLPFKLDQLQHVYRDPLAAEFDPQPFEKAAGPCHNDPNCFPEWQNVAKAVARVVFVEGGSGFLCTGTLINNAKQDFNPFWLTANHCIDNSSAAASSDFFWFYQTDQCGGTAPNPASVPRSQGASLIATTTVSDGTLLQVEGALPPGLFWSGYTANAVPNGNAGASIHHPAGDYKRISFEFKDGFQGCPNSNWTRVDWTDGPTEPGSSGSGVFRGDTKQLFGTLTGGPSACGNESFDCYGNFSSHYVKFKKALLAGGTDDNSEQNDSCSKAKLVKTGTLSNRIVKVLDEDWYKISVPKGKTLHIRLNFVDANGDVDLQFFGACGTDALLHSEGTGDSEQIDVTNVGTKAATALWRVFLGDSDTRNNYNMTITIN